MTILESNCILLEPKNLRIIRYYSEYPLATDFQYWVSHKWFCIVQVSNPIAHALNLIEKQHRSIWVWLIVFCVLFLFGEEKNMKTHNVPPRPPCNVLSIVNRAFVKHENKLFWVEDIGRVDVLWVYMFQIWNRQGDNKLKVLLNG